MEEEEDKVPGALRVGCKSSFFFTDVLHSIISYSVIDLGIIMLTINYHLLLAKRQKC